MLELKNVSLSYGGLRVLRDVSLRLDSGERIAVMGPSGCGKTSLLRVIAGLQSPDFGTVECMARRLSFVFQEPRLLPWLTAEENVRLVLPDAHRSEDAAALLSCFGLSDAADKLPAELSGGMQQLVSLTRALVCTPDLLLLDEPFKALDAAAKQNAITAVSGGTDAAIILVTHDAREAEALGCRVIDFSELNK